MLLLVCLFMLKEVFYKKNEKFEIEFFENEECIKVFDFKDAENLYIELHNGDVTPLMFLYGKIQNCTLYIPYLPNVQQVEVYSLLNSVLHPRGIKLHTLSQIGEVSNRIACIDNTAIFTKINNLSKYIPEDNAVLFVSGKVQEEYFNSFMPNELYTYKDKHIEGKSILENIFYYGTNINELQESITLFLPHGTQSELQKANKVAKELKEKYGVEEVNLFVLHCFVKMQQYPVNNNLPHSMIEVGKKDCRDGVFYYDNGSMTTEFFNINKIITTNSTGVLKPQNTERLQVIDCKELFEEWLKENN